MTTKISSVIVGLCMALLFLLSGLGTKGNSPPSRSYRPWTLVIVGDTQNKSRVMRWVMKGITLRNITYGLHLGDIHHCGNFKMWKWKRRLLGLSGARWLLAMGNHARYPCGRSRSKSWWAVRKLWTYFWHKNLGDTMRSHDVRGWRFIALDTASSAIPKGHVKRLQLALQSATGPVVLTMHRPLPVPFKILSTKVRSGRKWIYYARMDPLSYRHRRNKALWKTVVKYKQKIAAIFNGHFHAYGEYQLSGIPAYVSGGGGGPPQRRGVVGFYHWLSMQVTGLRTTDYWVKLIKWRTP